MNNIRTEEVSPNIGTPAGSFSIITGMLLVGFGTAIFGLWLMLPSSANGSGLGVPKEIVLLIVIALTVYLMRFVLPSAAKANLNHQYKIFGNKHTWVMSVIYTMTFGSFIGYAAAFPLAIKVIFGYQHIMVDGTLTHDTINSNGPSALMYAWMGPFIAANHSHIINLNLSLKIRLHCSGEIKSRPQCGGMGSIGNIVLIDCFITIAKIQIGATIFYCIDSKTGQAEKWNQ